MVIYAAITGVILEGPPTAAESGWEERGYVSIGGGGHGESEMRGGEVATGGRYRWRGNVLALAVVAAICTPIGGKVRAGRGEGEEMIYIPISYRLATLQTHVLVHDRGWGGGECEGKGRTRGRMREPLGRSVSINEKYK